MIPDFRIEIGHILSQMRMVNLRKIAYLGTAVLGQSIRVDSHEIVGCSAYPGMVGRIVVGHPDDAGWQGPAEDSDDLDPVALAAFPAVADILARGQVTPEEPG